MKITDGIPGMKVLFGRDNGEKTLGEIVKVNPTTFKVKQLEARGSQKTHTVGTIWKVNPDLCEIAPSHAVPAPVASSPRQQAKLALPDDCRLTLEALVSQVTTLRTSSSHVDGGFQRGKVAAFDEVLAAIGSLGLR